MSVSFDIHICWAVHDQTVNKSNKTSTDLRDQSSFIVDSIANCATILFWSTGSPAVEADGVLWDGLDDGVGAGFLKLFWKKYIVFAYTMYIISLVFTDHNYCT